MCVRAERLLEYNCPLSITSTYTSQMLTLGHLLLDNTKVLWSETKQLMQGTCLAFNLRGGYTTSIQFQNCVNRRVGVYTWRLVIGKFFKFYVKHGNKSVVAFTQTNCFVPFRLLSLQAKCKCYTLSEVGN